MRLARCEKGHYYDKDKFTTCPHCNDMQIAPSETVAFEDPDAKKEQEVVAPETPKVEVEERVLFSAATPVDEENKEIEDKFESRSSSVTDDDSDDLDEMVTIRLSEQEAVVSAALAGGEDAAMSREDTMADKDIAEETKEEPIAEEASEIEDKPSWEKPQEEEPVMEEASTIEDKPSWEESREEEPKVEEKAPEEEEASVTEDKPSWEETKEEEPKVEEKEPEEEEASVTENKPLWEEPKEEEPKAEEKEPVTEEAFATEDKPSWEETKEEEPKAEEKAPEAEEASAPEEKPSWEESPKEESVVEEEPTVEDTSTTEESSEVEQSVAATAESKEETLADAVPGRIPDEAILQDMNSNPVIGWLIAIEGIHKGRSYNVKQGRNFVGRSTAMDICLSGNSKISRERHAIITYDPRSKKCYLQPDESRDLIYINDDLLFGPMAMKHNDVITMGEEQFVFLTLQCDKADWV